MRILEIITPSRIGGVETHVANITLGLQALGDEVTVFCPAGRPLVEYLRQKGIEPITWKTRGKFDPKTLIRLASLIRSRKIDVVHTHLSSATFLGCLAARLVGKPSVATVHGFNSPGWYRFAGKIIAVSNAVKDHMAAQGIPKGKIEVVYNGIPLEDYRPTSAREAKITCDFDPEQQRVGVFGRLAPEKGQAVAVRAWPHLLSEVPDVRLMFVGAGKDEGMLRALADELGIQSSVDFTGFRPDPRSLMSACDVVIVPSLKEGLGLSAIEAMALERPVVVSDAGGLLEVVTDNETGLVVPRGEPEKLAEAIERVLRDSGSALGLARAGRKRVEERFSAAKQIVELRNALVS